MSERSRTRPACTVDDVCTALETMAPPGLAESWDNVGLLAGDLTARVRRMLFDEGYSPPHWTPPESRSRCCLESAFTIV